MRDFYEILGISAQSDQKKISKAYQEHFNRLVYQLNQEGFCQIRQAYSVLGYANTRQEYDKIRLEDPWLFEQYHIIQSGLYNHAESMVKTIKSRRFYFPQNSLFYALFADAYFQHEKPGKAAEFYQLALQDQPENAVLAHRLGEAYLSRGWHLKAISQFLRTLDLDQTNIMVWLGLYDGHLANMDPMSALEALEQGISVFHKANLCPLALLEYQLIFFHRVRHFNHVRTTVQMMNKAALAWNHTEATANLFYEFAVNDQLNTYDEWVDLYMEAAYELQPDHEKIKEGWLQTAPARNRLEQMKALAEDNIFSEIISELIQFEMDACDDPDCGVCQVERLRIELSFINEASQLRKQLLLIQIKYPALFELKSRFFKHILNQKDQRKLLLEFGHKIQHFMTLFPEEFSDEELEIIEQARSYEDHSDNELYNSSIPFAPAELDTDAPSQKNKIIAFPQISAQDKVGRNDPCPCGSGKKYKKCCGRT